MASFSVPTFLVYCIHPLRTAEPTFIAARVNVALLLVLALTSTGVYGIILGGWASNNKYSLMGGLRSAAQMVSYEVPFGLSIVGVLMMTGSLDLVKIVDYQAVLTRGTFIPQLVACFHLLRFDERREQPYSVRPAGSGIGARGGLSH